MAYVKPVSNISWSQKQFNKSTKSDHSTSCVIVYVDCWIVHQDANSHLLPEQSGNGIFSSGFQMLPDLQVYSGAGGIAKS